MPPPSWLILAFLLLHGKPAEVAQLLCDEDYDDYDCSSEGSYNQDSNEDEGSDDDDDEGHFTYKFSKHWSDSYPSCGGLQQSPINIEITDIGAMELSTPPLRGFGYEMLPERMYMENNGHTVTVTAKWMTNLTPIMWGGPLLGAYRFEQLHFHWGSNNYYGSEHTIGNSSYPLELHYVHYKTAYQNISNALKHADGVLVMAYIFSIGKYYNEGIDALQRKFSRIIFPHQKVELRPFPLTDLGINLFREGYIGYRGSLTTPPCTEAVVWLLSVDVESITLKQMDAFRNIILHKNDNHNCRETQPLNGRSVIYYYEDF